ncbi:MAG: hypothetical protein KKB51_15180 [Candidatus Riflebacteria bacterium]|nr:hypothetical protein [Candidatus Riflebacteria bacterium]
MVELPDSESVQQTSEGQICLQSFSNGRSLFWVIFLFMAVQTLLALIINFSGNISLFYLQPVVSVIFCALTVKIALATMTTNFSQAVAVFLVILAYFMATGFFFITAIFVGGLPG